MSRMWTEETKRLFVALDLPRDVAREVALWQDDNLAGRKELRVMGTIHLTLAFLGQLPVERVPELSDALSAIGFAPLRLTVEEAIFLPERRAKRVIALRLGDEGGALLGLQAEVSAALAERGLYKPEKRPVPAPRDGRPLPQSRSTFSPAKCELPRVWRRPDGLV